jgi:2-oxoisovalerate dehydrogenase E1 component alpha subunit
MFIHQHRLQAHDISVHFPGAVNSKFTSKMDFIHPSEHPAIPTYRVMDSDGVVLVPEQEPDIDIEEILTWYKNMVSGWFLFN